MKQNITHDQLNELSDTQMQRLLEWWESKIIPVPLLSIGQMIEVIYYIVRQKSKITDWKLNYFVELDTYRPEDICDVLWDEVKRVLGGGIPMNRIEEIKNRVWLIKHTAMCASDLCDEDYISDTEYLLSKLEIAEEALEALEESNILAAVDVNLIEVGYQFATGTELMIHDSRLRSIEKGNRAKALAKEALKQIRE